ncbi:MAG: hypothetical protein RBT75_08340 [Anaerolineae bacterium]|jgi:hypothetical protein|nr:hypothetical protein [Anaerolineae bacterium]
MVGLGVGIRALTAVFSQQCLGDAALLAVSVILITVIASRAIWWQLRYGGVRWKGRTVPTSSA